MNVLALLVPALLAAQEGREIPRESTVFASSVSKDGVRTNYADASVFKLDDGTYRMVLNTFTTDARSGRVLRSHLASAVSKDGLRFEIEEDLGFEGVATPRVFRFPGGFRMYYPSHHRSKGSLHVTKISSAFSKDGRKFEEEGVRIEPAAEAKSVGGPAIYRLDDGTCRMLFDEDTEPRGRIPRGKIFGASSKDGLTWSRDEAPTVEQPAKGREPGHAMHPFVLRYEERYFLLYSVHGRTHRARSSDGLAFERLGPLGIAGADPDAIVLENGDVRIFYGDFKPERGGEIYSAVVPKAAWR
ncbi:MAG: hypothetical protein HYY17_14615 [Planctomycetes bacterium]|nr:hypothetical protein [Planctomycetota bacterium]